MVAIGSIPPDLTTYDNYDFADFARSREPEPRTKPSHVKIFTDFAEPPEMADDLKAAADRGATCYYGFYFPDAIVRAFDEAHRVECPKDYSPKGWNLTRKRQIMHEASDFLGIRCFTRLETFAEHDDIVYFAYTSWIKTSTALCLPVYKIKELMQVLGIEGEPGWMLA